MVNIPGITPSCFVRAARAAVIVALLLLIVGLFVAPANAAPTNLVGTFALTAGTCQGGTASGTYFRMVQPSGTVANGPFVSNGDSTCADKTYTLLAPGSDGGAITGAYQPAPSPAFDGQGNSLANRIVVPALFFGVRFGLSTDPSDRQTGTAVPPLSVQADSGNLTGDLRAWEATWNKQDFNQGSPKPDGSRPKLTTAAHGTYDATTGAFVLEWTSTIAGGPFNDFTGSWHLAGTFRPAGTGSSPAARQPAANTRTATGAAAATTTASVTEGATTDTVATPGAEAAAPESGSAKVVGAVTEKGWKPPAWLIVVTAIVGIGAAFALLVPGWRTTTDDQAE